MVTDNGKTWKELQEVVTDRHKLVEANVPVRNEKAKGGGR